jgi:hypothetical protein
VTQLKDGREILPDMKAQVLRSPGQEEKFSQNKAIEACATKGTEYAGIQEAS